MTCLIVFVVTVIVCALAAPLPNRNTVQITQWQNVHRPDKTYTFVYGLSDGQLYGESGVEKQIGVERPIVVAGSYSFVAPDGKIYWVNYTADEFGYHPVVGVGTGGGEDFRIDSNAIKSLVG